ncbi:MAG: 4-hydroxy-tetrahydrodipicolinate synthase [Actinomycetota bacterium]|uniref:4-hydroxy-tetrahydrodipicolinate synthase n=1 Tax=marine metagenome TaxID=408172 RepID=A0A381QKW9_9ZZZZ|nr:4-hydroxy-tetrahydrodipicolinate synthase [Acidimicrobiales bacterium]MEC9316846.1 4-hydroxy-tetrahydrodipicolinate synthase [Actinomycetota bacterium]MED5552423.1 4-hydroxy-tetrahydrodipicolinate synthase [Actinomycetota bacterium]MEE2680137.1 4-hydroxy-tetrahydrodipicolinate synthase [Actinomycetota bacterium]MEE3187519.1 4-hydroxy-tetrahydrodipicolinate synthase [Actinomycetota bacterium]|tara:strand:+ start:2808 stop:3692 length:885 start_codon:yes stop_codon:yes gene_type:complete
MTARFGRVIPAMVTPFSESGALDVDASVTLAKWLVEQGSEGLVITGTTGEGPAVTDEEDWELWRAVAEAVTVPVIAGTTTNDTAHSMHQTQKAEELGCDAILAVTPYYNRPSQAGIYAHFEAVASSTSLPVVLYDIPVRTGRKIETSTMLELAHQVSNIVAVKDAAGNPGETAKVVRDAPEGFEVYSGDDALTLPLLAVGAVGVISVAAHWSAPEHIAMMNAWDSGDASEAKRINALLLESFDYETGDAAPNPVPTKAMMRTLGLPVGEPRLPMGPTPQGLEDTAREVYSRLKA